MRIHDKHAGTHELVIGATVWLDEHVLAHSLRTHNTLILHGFTVPHGLRRRGVGSVALHAIERHFKTHGVTHIQVAIPGCDDEAHRAFFTQNGYHMRKGTFEKFFAPA